jgi:TM2 domain-containing membrane protein YozV
MARFCTACGTQLGDETARFCAKCGAAVAAPPIPSATTTSPGASRSVGSSRNDKTLPANSPKPVVAGILAGLFPFGVGAVYVGQYVRAWTYLAIVVGLSIGRHQSSTLSIICSLTFSVLWVWQIADAVRTAKALRSVGGITGTSTIKRAVCVAALLLTLIAVPNLLNSDAASSQQNSPSSASPDASLTPQQIMCMDKLLTTNDWDNKTPAYYAGLKTCGWKAGQPIQPPLGSQ